MFCVGVRWNAKESKVFEDSFGKYKSSKCYSEQKYDNISDFFFSFFRCPEKIMMVDPTRYMKFQDF